jgi:RNA polymerase sigma-70 factor (ECF subfamily)
MTNETITEPRSLKDAAVTQRFLNAPSDATFADLFRVFCPKLVAFFSARGCALIAEDLAQEVMLTVHRKAGQVREHSLFLGWLFRIARNAISRHYARQTREVDTVDLAEIPEGLVAVSPRNGGAPAFEFNHWMDFLDDREKETLTLRFVEEWEYHEIAAAQNIPIGTVQWRVFNAKRKLAPVLKRAEGSDGAQAAKRSSLGSEGRPQRAARSAAVGRESLTRRMQYVESKAA